MKKIYKPQSNKGFTLVELLVALLISGMLLATIASVFLMSQKIYTRGGDISYKQKSITNIETDLQNALATATDVKTVIPPNSGNFYSIGFNDEGDFVEVINGNEYKTDQIKKITLSITNGNTMNYEIMPKNSMSNLKGGIVMNNKKNPSISTPILEAGEENYLVITLVN